MADYPYFFETGTNEACPYCGQRMPDYRPKASGLGAIASLSDDLSGLSRSLAGMPVKPAREQAPATQHFFTAEERRALTKSLGYDPFAEIKSNEFENPLPNPKLRPEIPYPKNIFIDPVKRSFAKEILIDPVSKVPRTNDYEISSTESRSWADALAESKRYSFRTHMDELLSESKRFRPMSFAEFDQALANERARIQAEIDAGTASVQADIKELLSITIIRSKF